MTCVKISLKEIPKNSMVEFYFPAQKPWERKPVLLVNYNGEIYALEAFCTHNGLSLEDGFLTDDGRIVCSWHGSVFDVKTGKVLDGPAKRDLKKYNVKIEGDEVIVSE
ncbi:Rieske (2Fe-2S) protein [Acidianus sp. HS-5]|uniref:Rieske (2Fe-2S) protein n=1 Tax=Acidianus sp. HS-5 TaxID=2886040 RepID=UPI001F2EF5D5|nr:Rieske (2Fe-2S) protein [Acidianus sp. HS-5]BDC17871.1 (2Fe-2S)-binding protein [Acidianus sp. HS-5]